MQVVFLDTADDSRRGYEPPFEVRDRKALAALCTASSPRCRKAPPGLDIPLAVR